jgi:hypothetical protein
VRDPFSLRVAEAKEAHHPVRGLLLAAVYTIFTSPNHPLVPGHLPTLIVTPHGRPMQTLCERGRISLASGPETDILCVQTRTSTPCARVSEFL